ncbi:hypothetical protein B1C78_05010 [Thioalkalivibrio denitrificans]|uniref:Uncharacterized protein n=1 Tax=Thioalkalivibrio denitrificans TaxID=108003 RepID=A0A1V3NMV0_9GAMM|nr:hypothetical protein B1C78_05010 [Thioalkalivibrio denitrificans]
MKGRHRWFYWAFLLLGSLLVFASVIPIAGPRVGIFPALVIAAAAAFVVLMPLDKYMESKYGILKRVDGEKRERRN